MNTVHNTGGLEKIKILYLEGNVLYFHNIHMNQRETIKTWKDIQEQMMLEIQKELDKLAKDTSKDENTIKLLNKIKEHIEEDKINAYLLARNYKDIF